jgi:hypothetical protein
MPSPAARLVLLHHCVDDTEQWLSCFGSGPMTASSRVEIGNIGGLRSTLWLWLARIATNSKAPEPGLRGFPGGEQPGVI